MPENQITVVIPCHNEELSLPQVRESIDAQTRQPDAIIAVDSASTDGTAALLSAWAEEDERVTVLSNPAKKTPQALNVALAKLSEGVYVRIDAHTFPAHNYIEETVETLLSDPEIAGVGSHKIGIASTTQGKANKAAYHSKYFVGNSEYHFAGETRQVDHVPFGVYRVPCLHEVGGWNERFDSHQDYEMDFRLRRSGYRLMLTGKTSIEWQMRETVPDLYKQYVRYGRGKARLAVEHPSGLTGRAVFPLVLWAWAAAPVWPLPLLARLLPAASYPLYTLVAAQKVGGGKDTLRVAAGGAAIQLGWATGLVTGLKRAITDYRRGEPK